jgi:cohesin complex subunit SA-1/2
MTPYVQSASRGVTKLTLQNSHARLEAVKAFASLLSKETFITNARTNIMRISSRLIEISLRDVDTNVRINALKALALLDKTGVLQDEEDDQRSRVIRVVFDQEPRVRRAVGDFVKGYLAEKTEALESTWSAVKGTKKKRGAKISEKDMRTYLGWKTLASMLVETYHELDSREASTSTAPTVSVSMGRATAAVEALRSSVEGLTNWQELVDYLLVDHSTAESDMWLLLEEEEDFMIQVLIACIKADAAEDVSQLTGVRRSS